MASPNQKHSSICSPVSYFCLDLQYTIYTIFIICLILSDLLSQKFIAVNINNICFIQALLTIKKLVCILFIEHHSEFILQPTTTTKMPELYLIYYKPPTTRKLGWVSRSENYIFFFQKALKI